MKYHVAVILMIILVIGITMINYHLRILFNIESLDAIAQMIWFGYCVVSGAWVGWNGANYLFSHFLGK